MLLKKYNFAMKHLIFLNSHLAELKKLLESYVESSHKPNMFQKAYLLNLENDIAELKRISNSCNI